MTGAIIGGAIIGGVASNMAASKQSSAATQAAETTAGAQVYSADLQKEMYEQTRTDQEPWRIAGEKALQTIQERPDFQFTADTFEQFKDPSYDFRMQEGVNALDRSAASRGRLLSGAQDRAVTRYGSDLASQEYGNAFNRAMATDQYNLGKQQSLAGVGQQATNLVSQAGQSTASGIANTTMSGAAAQGNAIMAGGAAQAQGYNGIAQSANQGIGNYLLYQRTLPYDQQAGFVGPSRA
jgi:hypothetical protein